MQKEIGSNFWLAPDETMPLEIASSLSPAVFGLGGNDYTWTSTGRSATSLVIRTIENRHPDINKTVCLSPFTCHTVFEPFVKAGYRVVTYPIDKSLASNCEEILECVLRCDAGIVLFHRYFGFDTVAGLDRLITELRARGIVSIEDCTQSLYSAFDASDADFYVASIRKWCGVPDGGFAICRDCHLVNKPTEADTDLCDAKVEASMMKYRWISDNIGDKDDFLAAYRNAENILAAQQSVYSINDLSLTIQQRLDVNALKDKRRRNFKALLVGINGLDGITPIFSEIPPEVTPLYFPVYCADRSKVQKLLASNSIYAPVVWPKADNCPDVCSEADEIYDHILCIPIDQRYDDEDMERIIGVLKSDTLWTGWMTWEQIVPFKEQLIDWELEVMVKYHYPDKKISRDYPASRVENLKSYLESGNTFFWGAIKDNRLLGYYWAYVTDFLGYKRWQSRSSYTCENARGNGISKKAHQAAIEKALEIGCDEAVSSYAHFNRTMAHIYENLGYEPSRIEIVKKLSKDEIPPPRFVDNRLDNKKIQSGWMTWEQIAPFKEQLIDWELEVMVKYHYPDKKISRDYPASRVENLKSYLESGNTFFWGAIKDNRLLGYYWAYICDTDNEKTWEIRSNYISEKARGYGLGMLSYISGLRKAIAEGCKKSRSMYASFNNVTAMIYNCLGYEITNIEVAKKL
ncbi:GNAT family N-acetyltransferase [Parabacteroides sp. ZJ-118]|uniref:GNAT family N-acetyltransferase n=1 Tax=Parabacteroides sp. ZJ-118 TaxID=2709398 RepID=UPI0013EA6E41|nr:GNAT family N-acetyltransferase [Parabacteroides sp. ZJ-118]